MMPAAPTSSSYYCQLSVIAVFTVFTNTADGSLMSIECAVLRTSFMFFWKAIRNLYSVSLITLVVAQHWWLTFGLVSLSSSSLNVLKRAYYRILLHGELLALNVAYQHCFYYNVFVLGLLGT